MKLLRALSTAGLVWGALAGAVPEVRAQVAPTHEVRKGDTLFAVTRKAKYDGVTRNQMILAIVRANQNAFPGGNINLMEVGTVLAIPARDVVAAIDPADADRQVKELLAAKPGAVPPVAAIKPAPAVIKPPVKPAVVPRGQENAARRFRDGQALELRGDHAGALTAFLEAGEGGYGPAQRKLGQIYDKGNAAAPRDYQAALHWYQKARDQGVELDKPLQRTTPK